MPVASPGSSTSVAGDSVVDISDGDATPTVVGGSVFKTQNTTPTTITDFTNGVETEEITVIFGDSNTTIDFNSAGPLKGNAGEDWSPKAGDSMQCVYDGSHWHCDPQENVS